MSETNDQGPVMFRNKTEQAVIGPVVLVSESTTVSHLYPGDSDPEDPGEFDE